MSEHLDTASAVPLTTASARGSAVGDGASTAVLVDEVDAKQSTDEPEDGTEESECDIGFPALAESLVGDIAPVEDGTTVKRADEVNQQAKRHNPHNEERQVDGPVDEATGKGEQPEES